MVEYVCEDGKIYIALSSEEIGHILVDGYVIADYHVFDDWNCHKNTGYHL